MTTPMPQPPKPQPPPTPPGPSTTTSAELEAALEGVHDLGGLALAEHVVRFNTLHDSMIAALAAVDEV